MPYRSSDGKLEDMENYLKARRSLPFGKAILDAQVTKAQVEGWRKDGKFREKEAKAKSVQKSQKRVRQVSSPKEMHTAKVKPKEGNIPPRKSFKELISFYSAALREAKNLKGTYQKSDEQQIADTARIWASVELCETEIFKNDTPFVKRTKTQAILDPIWTMYTNLLKQLQRSLQALGLNHDSVGYAIKQKKKGVLDDIPQYDEQGRLIGTQGIYN